MFEVLFILTLFGVLYVDIIEFLEKCDRYHARPCEVSTWVLKALPDGSPGSRKPSGDPLGLRFVHRNQACI